MSNLKMVTYKLSDVVDINKSNLSNQEVAKNNKIKYIDLSAVDSPGTRFRYTEILSLDASSRARRIVSKDSIGLSSLILSLKSIFINKTDIKNLIASTGFFILDAKKDLIDPDYLFQLIQSESFMNSYISGSQGGTFEAIPLSHIESIEIEIPVDLKEQKRIAEILSNVDDNIRVVEEEITNHQNLINAVVKSIKGNVVKISDLVDIRGGRLETQMAKDNGKYPFYVCAESPLKIDFADYNQEAVLIAGTGAVYCFYVNGMFNARQKVHILTKKKELEKDFNLKTLFYIINNNLRYFRSLQAGGALKNVDQDGVMGFTFTMPTNEIEFLNACKTIELIIDNKNSELLSLKRIKQGLLKKLL